MGTKLKDLLVYLFFLTVLYMYLFNPYPFKGGLIKLLYPFALYTLFTSHGKKEVLRCRSIIYLMIAILFFDIFRTIIGSTGSRYVNSFINIIEMVLIPIGICIFYKEFVARKSFQNEILIICLIASLISIFLAFNPELNIRVRLMLNFNIRGDYELSRRMYGITQFLLFTYPILLGFITARCFFIVKHGWLLSTFAMVFAIALNARIGLVVLLVCSFILLFTQRKLLSNIILMIFLLFVFSYLLKLFQDRFSETSEWINEGFIDTYYYFMDDKRSMGGTLDSLGSMWILPNTLSEWLIGRGVNIYRGMVHTSDVGYFIQLNYGGLIYLFLLFSWACAILSKLYKNTKDKALVLCVLITLIIANYKGQVLGSNEFTRFVIIYAIYSSLSNHQMAFTQYSIKK